MKGCFFCNNTDANIRIVIGKNWQCFNCWGEKNSEDKADKRLKRFMKVNA